MRRLPLRRYLFLLVTAGILPLAVLGGAGLYLMYEDARTEALRHGRDVTRALAIAVDTELKGTISALQFLVPHQAEEFDPAAFHRRAARAIAARPDWLSLSLAHPDGERVADTRFPVGDALPPLIEMQTVEELRRSREPQVGVLTPGRGGRQAFSVRVPVMRGSEMPYVLSAVIDPQAIRRLVERQAVPDDWVLSVFDSKGLRVARSRSHDEYFASPASRSLRELMAANETEGWGVTRSMEGDEIFTAFTRLPYGWSVAIGIPTAPVNAAAARSIAIYAGAMLLSILVGLAVAYWLARHANRSMSHLSGAARALGRGEVPTPVDSQVAEICEVGNALAEAGRERLAFERERDGLLASERAARADAEQANRQKDQFLAMLAHELRNPLAAISNASSLLDDERAGVDKHARARGVIRRQVAHLAHLTDDLLDAARALLGKIQLQQQPIDVAAVAAQAVRTLGTAGRGNSHRIVERLEPVWVSGDAVRLDQVIANLLENAVKYTPEGGAITLTTRREGSNALVSVADTGLGIAPELAPRVFDLFVQGPRGIDRTQGGLGIGLTLVRRLVELHGGSVEVRSAGEGTGSEFVVTLPAIEAPAAAQATEAAMAAPKSRSILLVEDNDDARETLQTLLEMIGHRVESARDGVGGLEKALAISPEIAIVDIGLPGLDGFEVARRIRAAGLKDMVLIALTGYGTEEDRRKVMQAGFDAHLTKPADITQLELLMREPPQRETGNPSALSSAERL